MKRWSAVLTVVLSTAFAFGFAVQNARQVVDVRLGPITIRGASLPAVVFGAMLLGMLVVLIAGLRADMRARVMMRTYREKLGRPD